MDPLLETAWEMDADSFGLLEKVRRRAGELRMPLSSALKQALLMFLNEHPDPRHSGASQQEHA